MKIGLLLLFFTCFSLCFSQNIKGRIVSDSLSVNNVEVINLASKEVVKSNKEGNFEIKASAGNWITFYHKNYDVVKIYIDSLFDYNKSLEIILVRKSEKIEEILVTKTSPFFGKINSNMPVIPYNKPSVSFSDGTVYTGFDFNKIGALLFSLFQNKDKIEVKKREPIQFLTFARQSYSEDFLIKSLKLNPEEIESFLSFCNFDSKSKEVVENQDKMNLLQFLLVKSEEYKKLHQKQ